ncbi:MAG TPA: PEPxxWA-CTERM sorting domain-containing protein [Caulobacteraceae bacterium]|nr:PEPxxWA-CTERM sorting domain-containing protein [Caulobacteraceae bacterium]
MRFSTFLATATVLAASLSAVSAHADELVVNGGFETGDFSGWSLFDNTGFTSVNGNNVATGSYSAEFGAVGSTGGITQNLTTVPGGSYLLQFDLQNDGGSGTSFNAAFDGQDLLTMTNPPSFGYTHYSYTVTASDPLSALTFTFRQDPYYYHLDNVSVQSVVGGAVPEPATWATLIFGLGMVGAMMRRRRTAMAAV